MNRHISKYNVDLMISQSESYFIIIIRIEQNEILSSSSIDCEYLLPIDAVVADGCSTI